MIDSSPPPLSLGRLHCNVNESYLISVQLGGRGSGGDGTAVREIMMVALVLGI